LNARIGFVAQKDAAVEEPTPENLYTVGVVGDIRRLKNLPDGQRVWVQGGQRFKILGFLQTEPYLVARVQLLSDAVPATTDFEARIVHLRQEIARAAALLPEPAPDLASLIDRLTDPAVLIDCAASWLDVSVAEKQEILEMLDLEARLKKVAAKLARQIEVLEITKKIGSETKDALDRSQREFVLREQMKAIQKELGGSDHKTQESDELRKKLQAAKMPPEIEKDALKELARFERMPEGAAEASMVRTYLDLLAELPWSVATEERIDLNKAREILDADHRFEKVKRILNFLPCASSILLARARFFASSDLPASARRRWAKASLRR
jgi:ATP-dependent Lon protease